MLLPAIANLLTKGRIKYGVTGSVGVRVRVSINIKYILYFIHVLHFIHLHLVGDTTVVRTEHNIISRTTYRARALNHECNVFSCHIYRARCAHST